MSEDVNRQERSKKPGSQGRMIRSSNMEMIQPPSTLQSDILIRLGLSKPSVPYPSSESLPQLRTELKSKDWRKKIQAIQSLVELGEQAPVKDIINCQDDADEAVRMAAVRALGKLAAFDIVSLEPFIYALNDSNRYVRATSVHILATLGHQGLKKSHIEGLIKKLLEKSEDELVRIEIVQLLGSLGADAPLRVLRQALQDDDYQVRELAMLALGRLWNRMPAKSFIEILISAFYDEEHAVHEAAIIALSNKLPVNTVINPLMQDLYSADTTIQAKAAHALGDLGIVTLAIQDALVALAINRETGRMVRVASILALAALNKPIERTVIATLLTDDDEDIHDAAVGLAEALYPGQFRWDDSDQGVIDFQTYHKKD